MAIPRSAATTSTACSSISLPTSSSEQHGIDLRNDSVALQRLKEAGERAKIELSSAMTTDVNLPFIAAGPSGPVHLMRELDRGQLERACKGHLDRLEAPCRKALDRAHCAAADIDQVLLVGGMTRMPAVQERAERIFGKPGSKGVNPDEIVAMGAAVHSGMMGGELQEVVLLDVTPHDMGVRVAGDKMSVVIAANTSIPTRAKKVFATNEDNQTFVAIEIYQGESESVAKNRRLGRFVLSDLTPAPRGRRPRSRSSSPWTPMASSRSPRSRSARDAPRRHDRGVERPDGGRAQAAGREARALTGEHRAWRVPRRRSSQVSGRQIGIMSTKTSRARVLYRRPWPMPPIR